MKSIDEIKSNPFGKYNGNEIDYVLEYLDSEDLDRKKNPFVQRFEKKFCEILGVKYAIAHNSGTSTLHSCLVAAGVGAGDEVIIPAHTVIMCAFTALHQNAIPVFADIDPDTFNIDPKDIERKITPKTKAIIAVHMHGLPADMNAIMKIARKHNIIVIEDSAQCVLGKINGQVAGTMGDMASWSFETKKHLSIGEGGMVTTNNTELATTIRKNGGIGYKTLAAGQSLRQLLPADFQNPNYKRHDVLGWNYRMNEISAAVGLAQLERVEFLVNRRMEIARLYLEVFNDCNWITPQKTPKNFVNSYWTFTAKYEGQELLNKSWFDFYNLLKGNGGDGFYGGLSVCYEEPVMQNKPFLNSYLPDINIYKDKFNYEKGNCPNAEKVQPKLMQFKTNYRNMYDAKNKIDIIRKTIRQMEGK